MQANVNITNITTEQQVHPQTSSAYSANTAQQTHSSSTESELSLKISKAEHHKNQGNTHFKNKQYIKALRQYHNSNLYLTGLIDKQSPMASYINMGKTQPQREKSTSNAHPHRDPTTTQILDDQSSKKVNQLKFSIYMNMSQIYIYQSKFEKALQILNKAVLIKQNNKLKYRQGVCYLNLGHYDKAKVIFQGILKGEEDQGVKNDIRGFMEKIRAMEKKDQEKSRKMFGKFFSSSSSANQNNVNQQTNHKEEIKKQQNTQKKLQNQNKDKDKKQQEDKQKQSNKTT